MHDGEVFAQGLVEMRAAPAAEDHGRDIERRDIRMRRRGDMPGHVQPREFSREFAVRDTPAQLRRLLRNEDRRETAAWMRGEEFGQLRMHGIGIDIADHDEEHIVRHVTALVVGHHFIALQAVEDVEIADDRMPAGMFAESGGEERLAAHAIRVVHAHGEFAADDLLFLGVFLHGQGGIHHRIGQQIERDRHAFGRDIDPVNRPLEGGVGIDVAAGILDALGKGAGAAGRRPLEQHVLEEMRQPGAEMRILMDAAGFDPGLHAATGAL